MDFRQTVGNYSVKCLATVCCESYWLSKATGHINKKIHHKLLGIITSV